MKIFSSKKKKTYLKKERKNDNATASTAVVLTYRLLLFVLYAQQTLPVDLSSSSIRSGGGNGASFHGSTSAFDPCCPGSTSRPPAFVSQATPGPSQPAAIDSFSSSIVAQPQSQPQPCRHYMHPSCEYHTSVESENKKKNRHKRDITTFKKIGHFESPIPPS